MGVRTTDLKTWEKPENLKKVTQWARKGLTNIQIAHNIGIVEQTLYKWKNSSEAFNKALEEGKAVVVEEIVNKSYEMMKGYTYEEVTETIDENGNVKEVKKTKKYAQPDKSMIIFFLKTMASSQFRDNQLTAAQARKLEIETAILEESLKALKGEGKNTDMLDSLVNLFKDK